MEAELVDEVASKRSKVSCYPSPPFSSDPVAPEGDQRSVDSVPSPGSVCGDVSRHRSLVCGASRCLAGCGTEFASCVVPWGDNPVVWLRGCDLPLEVYVTERSVPVVGMEFGPSLRFSGDTALDTFVQGVLPQMKSVVTDGAVVYWSEVCSGGLPSSMVEESDEVVCVSACLDKLCEEFYYGMWKCCLLWIPRGPMTTVGPGWQSPAQVLEILRSMFWDDAFGCSIEWEELKVAWCELVPETAWTGWSQARAEMLVKERCKVVQPYEC